MYIGVVMLGGLDDGVGNAVADGFRANGHLVSRLLVDGQWPDGLDLVVVPGPMQPLTPLILRLHRMSACAPVAIWYTEQVPNPKWPAGLIGRLADLRWQVNWWLEKSQDRLRFPSGKLTGIAQKGGRLRLVGEVRHLYECNLLKLLAVFTPSNEKFFRRWPLPVARVPMGYHPSFGELLHRPRDIDVVFLGSTRDARRRRIVGQLAKALGELGICFVIKDGSPERGAVHGNQRTEFLNRAKIMLNIMRQPWDDPVFRILLAAPNGAMVLSEEIADEEPFKPGYHFAMAPLNNMVDAIQYYLAHESERSIISERAHDFVTRELTMERTAAQLIKQVG